MANGTIIMKQYRQIVGLELPLKWQTRRGPLEDGTFFTETDDSNVTAIHVRGNNGQFRKKWFIGQHLCIMTGRGKPALWRIPVYDVSETPPKIVRYTYKIGHDPAKSAMAYERVHVTVTALRIERLQDMPAEDALAEGVADMDAYKTLFSSINGPKAWSKNPRVAVISFDYEA